MGRANNSSRNAIILSRQQGWDSTKIEDGRDMPSSLTPRESPYVSDSKTISGVPDPQAGCGNPGPQSKDWNAPDVSREKPDHTKGADPYPGMPGAR